MFIYNHVGHKLKRDGSRLLRSLSVVAAVALNDQTVESDDDTTQGNSKSEVEGEKNGKAQEQPAQRVERLPMFLCYVYTTINM